MLGLKSIHVGKRGPCQWPGRIGVKSTGALRWRHNEHDGVSNHQPRDCLLNRLLRRRSKKTSKLRVTGLCEGNSPVTGEFPAQRASNAENVSIWWRHHDLATTKRQPCIYFAGCTATWVPKPDAQFITYNFFFFIEIDSVRAHFSCTRRRSQPYKPISGTFYLKFQCLCVKQGKKFVMISPEQMLYFGKMFLKFRSGWGFWQ